MKLSTSDLGLRPQVPVYVNEHLCPELKTLLGQVTAKRRKRGWKHLWFRNGQIFARKADESPVVKISSPNNFSKMAEN